MKKFSIIALIVLITLPIILTAKVNYLNEEEYKDLSKAERGIYWENLTQSRTEYMNRKADAIARQEAGNRRLEELRGELNKVDEEHGMVYNDILNYLKVDQNDSAEWGIVEKKIDYFNKQINGFNSLSDGELWQGKKDIFTFRSEWNDYRDENYSKIPDFMDDVMLIENRLTRLENDLESKKPAYTEDTYTVVKGEYLSKIAGYKFIYDDPSLWGIIYRANRDQIKDPNILDPNLVLKIPRGKPNVWKVYKGECLWNIAQYPEVYGTGTKWPMLFRANEDKISDPDMIYPNQVLEIPRD